MSWLGAAGWFALAMLLARPLELHATDALCDHEQVQKIQKGSCETYSVPYRHDGAIVQVEIAAVVTGWTSSSPVIDEQRVYLMRLPDGELVRLKNFPALDQHRAIARDLGFGQAEPDPEVIYEYQAVERIGRRYCVVYAAKYPFEGRNVGCLDSRKRENSIRFVPGVVPASQARSSVCSALQSSTCHGLRSLKLVRLDDGNVVYRAETRMRQGVQSRAAIDFSNPAPYTVAVPLVYEERVYEVTLQGAISLESTRQIVCDRDCQVAGSAP